MARMVRTDAGWVNLDHIVTVEARGSKLLFKDAQQCVLAVLSDQSLDANDVLAPVIPATPAIEACAVTIRTGDDNSRPTEEDLLVDHVWVVGWRLSGGRYPEPIVAPTPFSTGTTIFVTMPDGRVWDSSCEDLCISLEEAKACLLRSAQQQWDSEYSKTGAEDNREQPSTETLTEEMAFP